MAYEIHASIKELTRPRSGGRPSNPHAVSARKKVEPDFERMRRLMQDHDAKDDREAAL